MSSIQKLNEDDLYFLLDLERTIGNGKAFYWKAFKRGYTSELDLAGKYTEIQANQIIEADHDKHTIKISANIVDKIINRY